MKFADRVKEKTTATSAAVISLGGAATNFRAFAAAFSVGDTGIPVSMDDGAGKWESGLYTLTSAGTLTRTSITASSNGGNAVVFGAGQKDVFCAVTAGALDRLQALIGGLDVPFSTSVPLINAGTSYMPPQAVSGPLIFTPAASAVRGALVYLRLVADGVNAPNFSAFKEWGGSLGYDNRAGIPNQVQFFHDGVDSWVSISQAIGAAPATDTVAPTMSGSITASAISDSGFTIAWSAGADNIAVTGYERSTDGGTTYVNIGNVLSSTVTGLTAETTYQVRVRAYDAAGNRSAPLSAAVTTVASGTGNPGDTTAPTMSGTITTSSVTQTGYTATWPAATDAVGVTGYEFSRNAGSSYTNLGNALSTTVTDAAAGSTEQIRVRAYDAAGNRASPLSASVTLLSAPVDPSVEEDGRLVSLDRVAEEGSAAPYSYYPTATTAYSSSQGAAALFTKALPAGADGGVELTFIGSGSGLTPMLCMKTNNTTGVLANQFYALFLKETNYEVYRSGTRVGVSGTGDPVVATARQSGDSVRMRREGTSVMAEIRRAGSTEWVLFYTWLNVNVGQLHYALLMAGTANTANRITGIRYKGLV